MRIVELVNKLQLPLSNEEADLLTKFDEGASIFKSEFNERQQHIANQLVTKDVLRRKNQDGKITYKKKVKG